MLMIVTQRTRQFDYDAVSNTWDTKYVTVSNTWARKDTVTSYFKKYTLCTVRAPSASNSPSALSAQAGLLQHL